MKSLFRNLSISFYGSSGVPNVPSVEITLGQASEREKEYDWLEATESYEKALGLVPEEDYSRLGAIYEQLGYAFYRAAMQAESQEEFKANMQRGIEACERAYGFYEKLENEQKTAWMFRCKAVEEYFGFWLTFAPSERRKLLDECLDLETKALTDFLKIEDMREYCKTYGELSMVFYLRYSLEWDGQTAKRIVEKGLELGEKAVAAFSNVGDLEESAKVYVAYATCLFLLRNFVAFPPATPQPEELEKNQSKIIKNLSKAAELSEKVGDDFLLGFSHFWLGQATGGEESVIHSEKALECGKRTRDNLLIAESLWSLAYLTFWRAVATEEPEKRKELVEKALKFCEECQHHSSTMSFMIPLGAPLTPPSGHAEYDCTLASWETDPEKRLRLLEKSEKEGIAALKLAEDSDIPNVLNYTLHVISKTLEARAHAESDASEKGSLLEKALKQRKRSIEIIEQSGPFDYIWYWNMGVYNSYLAGIEAELAEIQGDFDKKRRLLEEAMTSKEKCLELCNKTMPYFEKTGETALFAALHKYQDTYATLLTRLYSLTKKPEHLRRQIEVSHQAIESAGKVDMVSLMAESYWKIAKAHDILGEHLKAAESFQCASESYVKATGKIPQLKNFYQDFASYMHAWSEIEKAKHHHIRQEYGLAKEHFEKVANLHKSLKQWNYLASNYAAWALIEQAEDLSRKEQSEEALQTFEQTVKLFEESRESLKIQLGAIEASDEKEMATDIVNATDVRQEYCRARIALEEAKILDKKGKHHSSSEKYGLAAETFEKISNKVYSEVERNEFRLLISLSRAWQKMALAEVESSPQLYAEASELFEKAKDLGSNEETKLLALGHSRICKALEAGTRFEDTSEASLHAIAIQHLESAAKYYAKAGFPKDSEYVKATKLLFDAYVYMDRASKESDPEKKAKLYMMAEKVLQTSAGCFLKAEHPGKREQVLRLLEKVKEERELAISLTELLHASSIISNTTSFTTPTPTREEAVGLEKFEHADIQARVIIHQKDLKVGESLEVEVELINIGKSPATLVKITEVLPQGFELTEKPEMYRMEEGALNMKGKRLDPLKTEEVKLTLEPRVQGVFFLKPIIMYLDENGKYKSHEPEPVSITVKELGIKGWLKGER